MYGSAVRLQLESDVVAEMVNSSIHDVRRLQSKRNVVNVYGTL